MKSSTILSVLFATVAAIPMAANADTVTTNGVTWTYTVNNATKKTVTLGAIEGDTFDTNVTPDDTQRAMPAATQVDASLIPWTFNVGDDTYTVTALGSQAFNGCTGLRGTINFPSSVTTLGRACLSSTSARIGTLGGVTTIYGYTFSSMPAQPFPDISKVTSYKKGTFYQTPFTGVARVAKSATIGSYRAFARCAGMEGLFCPGPDTVSSGTQTYTSMNMQQFADRATSMKCVFFGPNTKATSQDPSTTSDRLLNGVTGCKVFVPANGFWSELKVGGSNDVIYYGATTNLDFAVDDDAGRIVAKPKTEAALLKVVESAPLFKKYFGWNTVVEVPNDLTLSAGSLTAEMFTGLEPNSLVLMFSVTTQAKMNGILAAVPGEAMIGVDPTGLTEKITISRYDNVFVKSAPGVEISRTVKGFVLIVK